MRAILPARGRRRLPRGYVCGVWATLLLVQVPHLTILPHLQGLKTWPCLCHEAVALLLGAGGLLRWLMGG